jgi:uncharacterized protein YacL (UPF0231 family)
LDLVEDDSLIIYSVETNLNTLITPVDDSLTQDDETTLLVNDNEILVDNDFATANIIDDTYDEIIADEL